MPRIMKLVRSIALLVAAAGAAAATVDFPGAKPGSAKAEVTAKGATLGNKMFTATFNQRAKGITFGGLKLADGTEVAAAGSELFTITLEGGKVLPASKMKAEAITLKELKSDSKAEQLGRHHAGKELSATFTAPDGSFTVKWHAVLRNGSHYLRQEFDITAKKDTTFVSLQPLEYRIKPQGALSISGNTTHGRVVVDDAVFIGLETPMSLMEIKDGNTVTGTWERKATLPAGDSWNVSSVLGFFAPQQQRRSFLAYSERERAVPYHLFVHYNDWYEVGIRLHDNKDPLQRTTEKISLDTVQKWKREMFDKRGVSMDAFVIDDGWDEFDSLWDFHKGFPNGFAKVSEAAKAQGSGIGTWLGPVGGYGTGRNMRIKHWNDTHPGNQIQNFQFSNKEYFNAFTGRCKQMIKDYDMCYFKFDGLSNPGFHSKGPRQMEDTEGIINVIRELRKARKNLFVNTTCGSWPSPFWFHFSDALWRQEDDFNQKGNMGDDRDRWLTFRDRLVHEVFVEGAPLCPINSIMVHGTIITKNGPPHVMSKEPANCIKEMRCSFGSGSALQEVYVDADLMDQENGRLWDELAECIKWARRNADVLADIHWVGGNPWNGKDGDIYGWAAWNKQKCTLTLRNSSDKEKTLHTTLRKVLDVPPSVKGSITLKSSFADQRAIPGLMDTAVDVDKEIDITLKPFEVIVMEGVPR